MPFVVIHDGQLGNLSDLSANAGRFDTQRTNAQDGMRYAQAADSMAHRDDALAFRYSDAVNRANIAQGHDQTRLANTGLRNEGALDVADLRNDGALERTNLTQTGANGRSAAGITSREGIATANREQNADQFGRRMDFQGDQAALHQENFDRNYDARSRQSRQQGEQFRQRYEQTERLNRIKQQRESERQQVQQTAKAVQMQIQEAQKKRQNALRLLMQAQQDPQIANPAVVAKFTAERQKWEAEIERLMVEAQKTQKAQADMDQEDADLGGETPQSGGYPSVQHNGVTYAPTGEMGPDGHPLYEAVA